MHPEVVVLVLQPCFAIGMDYVSEAATTQRVHQYKCLTGSQRLGSRELKRVVKSQPRRQVGNIVTWKPCCYLKYVNLEASQLWVIRVSSHIGVVCRNVRLPTCADACEAAQVEGCSECPHPLFDLRSFSRRWQKVAVLLLLRRGRGITVHLLQNKHLHHPICCADANPRS